MEQTPPIPDMLDNATPKDRWHVDDCFRPGGHPARSFVHRNYSMGMHTHDFIEMNLVLSGQGYHYIEGARCALERGDMFVIPLGMRHGYVSTDRLDIRHLLLHPALVAAHAPQLRALPGYLVFFTVEPSLRAEAGMRYALRLNDSEYGTACDLYERIEAETNVDDAAARLISESLSLHLMALTCRWYASQHAGTGKAPRDRMQSLQASLRLMEHDFAGKITLEDLARAAHLERSHFCRMFRHAVGVTPMEYLHELRIRAAKDLLRNSALSIAAISLEVGFYDAAHFSRTFRKHTGVSPLQFRAAP